MYIQYSWEGAQELGNLAFDELGSDVEDAVFQSPRNGKL
jgi:hypothetical protein